GCFSSVMFLHSSLNVPKQHFNQIEIGTLTRPLQHLDTFFLRPFYHRLAAVFGLIALNCVTSPTLEYLVYRGVHGPLSDCKEPRTCGCRTSPNHHPSFTVPNSWYEVFVLICRLVFS
ncbi:hypothetical protein CHARACLAT_022986, partial [Characodon lateralis]|nr:hypothetical protein [Characodon lateralis]